MFDKYVLGPRSMDVQVNHTERRAPTDESVRLLREMEAAARSAVVESVRLNDNTLDAVVHRYEDAFNCKTHFSVHYTLNGHKREALVTVDAPSTIEQRIDMLRQELADDIARFILCSFTKGIRP